MLIVQKADIGFCKNCLRSNREGYIFEISLGNSTTGNTSIKVCEKCAGIIRNAITMHLNELGESTHYISKIGDEFKEFESYSAYLEYKKEIENDVC